MPRPLQRSRPISRPAGPVRCTPCTPVSVGVAAVLLAILLATTAGIASAHASLRHGDAVAPVPGRYQLPVPAPAGTAPDAPPSRALLASSGVLVHDFDAPDVRWGAGHRGVDLLAGAGAAVMAPQAGTVSFSGVVVDRPLLVVLHPDGRRSTLEPVRSDLAVGDTVAAGDVVGTIAPDAANHCAPERCVHWGVRHGEVYVDPLALLGASEPIVLLPNDP